MTAADVYGTLKTNWRSVLLTVMLIVSGVAMFAPAQPVAGGGAGPNQAEGATNLEWGLELGGGSRIRAPVVGMTAELDQPEDPPNRRQIVDNVTEIEGVDREDVLVTFADTSGNQAGGPTDAPTMTVELFLRNVSETEFAERLRAAGLDATESDVRDGVTAETRQQIVRTIRNKIDEAGFGGSRVSQASSVGGQNFIVIEAPDKEPEEIRDLLTRRGSVRLVARYPVQENGSTQFENRTVLGPRELTSNEVKVGVAATDDRTGQPYVPITLSNDLAQNFTDDLNEVGFTTEGIEACPRDWRNATHSSNYCLLTVTDDRVVHAAGVRANLAELIRTGAFVNEPTFRMTTQNISEAQGLQINLRGGRLRAPLDFERGQTYEIEPTLAERFRFNSLVTGIVAVLAVSLMVFLRYGDAKVALPMILTALSEVVILLGFAAAIGLRLDLSHIAGFIAVIGTGVDDLIIIADEVMSEGDVSSGRVFQSRFRKAFWVIGAAAATTIIAMSPLAVLQLGDLRGFAIITILGVLVGVLVTRPAYGDILRSLLTDH